jgi:hypothetical protein
MDYKVFLSFIKIINKKLVTLLEFKIHTPYESKVLDVQPKIPILKLTCVGAANWGIFKIADALNSTLMVHKK